jgi:acyl carrier protein
MKQRLIKIICEIKGEKALECNIDENSSIIEDIGIDSLQMINLILKVEEEFGIEIDFDDFDYTYLSSISTFCDFISSKQ